MSSVPTFKAGCLTEGINTVMSKVHLLPEGIVFWELRDETALGAERVANLILEGVQVVGKPRCLLVDMSLGGRGTSHETNIYSRFLKNHPLDAIAVFGLNMGLRVVVQTVCILAGFRNIHFFKNKTDALGSLKAIRDRTGDNR